MKQKVIKVGNSLAITLPAKFTKKSGIEAGTILHVDTDPTNKTILIKSENDESGLTPDFYKWLNKMKQSNEKIYKELAKL